MIYRRRPLARRPELWRLLACGGLLFSVLSAMMAGYSFIDGSGFPPGNVLVAFGFALLAVFCLIQARKWDR